jgi:hypothetical protein
MQKQPDLKAGPAHRNIYSTLPGLIDGVEKARQVSAFSEMISVQYHPEFVIGLVVYGQQSFQNMLGSGCTVRCWDNVDLHSGDPKEFKILLGSIGVVTRNNE